MKIIHFSSSADKTEIHHDHLEFVFNHKENKIYVRDHIYKIEYELQHRQEPNSPFAIIVSRHLHD